MWLAVIERMLGFLGLRQLFNINERAMFISNKADGCRTVIKMDCIRTGVVQNTLG